MTTEPRRYLPYVMLILIWGLLHGLMLFYHGSPVLDGKLVDTDSYMRLVRVGHLLNSGAWYDSSIANSNAPYGEVLHWTRPLDLLLIGFSFLLTPLLGAKAGLFWAGALVSPLLQLATAFAFIWAMAPLLKPNRWIAPLAALFLQPAALPYFVLGRADHHSLLLFVFVLAAGFMFRALMDGQDRRAPLFAGAAAGFGLWLSPELLILTLACLLALGLPWLLHGKARTAQNGAFALGLITVVIIALFAEHPPGQLTRTFYDQISWPHIIVCTVAAGFWLLALLAERTRWVLASGRVSRAGMVLICGPLAGLAVLLAFPDFFRGAMAETDPRVIEIWLSRVTEMRAVTPTSTRSLGEFIYYFGLGAFALPTLLWLLWREADNRQWYGWCFLLIGITLYWPLSIAHVRLAGFAECLFVMAVALLLDRLFDRTETMTNTTRRALVRSLGLYVLIGGSLGLGQLLMQAGTSPARAAAEVEAKTNSAACDLTALTDFLAQAPAVPQDRPLTILAFLDFGPELLYRSHHRVIATPYHRNGDGVFDSHAMLATTNEGAARKLMAERQVDLVLLCPGSPERGFFSAPGSTTRLYDRLVRGEGPAWLAPVTLPAPLSQAFLLYSRAEEPQKIATDTAPPPPWR